LIYFLFIIEAMDNCNFTIPDGKAFRKIPTLFDRDWDNDASLVTRDVNPNARWVTEGKGYATQKMDGTCCWITPERKLYKRRDVKTTYKKKKGKTEKVQRKEPDGFILVQEDASTGHKWGWMPVSEQGNEDRWHREAFAQKPPEEWMPGTYELLGPKVQRNLENVTGSRHVLEPHGCRILENVPRDFDGLKEYFSQHPDIEGIVWYRVQDNGDPVEMVKIKGIDFGVQRIPSNVPFAPIGE
jgi:hypothetical protein